MPTATTKVIRKHDPKLVARAHLLHSRGVSYKDIVEELEVANKVKVGVSTVRDWVANYSRVPRS